MTDVTRKRGPEGSSRSAEASPDMRGLNLEAAASSSTGSVNLMDGDGSDEVIASLTEQANILMSQERREDLREEELVKLRELGTLIEVERDQIPKGAKIFYPRWVDAADESKLVVHLGRQQLPRCWQCSCLIFAVRSCTQTKTTRPTCIRRSSTTAGAWRNRRRHFGSY